MVVQAKDALRRGKAEHGVSANFDGGPEVEANIEVPLDLWENENEIAEIIRSILLLVQFKSMEGSSWLGG